MSGTTSKPTLGRAVLRVVLPGVALILGLTFVIMGAFSVRADPLLRSALVLGGGAASVCGFLALLWGIRARFSDDPVVRAASAVRSDMAIGGLFLVLGVVGMGGATQEIIVGFQPAQAFDARLDRLHIHRSLRRGGDAHLYLAGVRQPLEWHCAFDCAAADDLRRLQDASGAPVHLTKLGKHLIGLTTQDHEFLWPEAERSRLKATSISMWLAFAAMAVGAAAYVSWRYRTGYRRSRPVGPDYRVLLQDRLSRGRKVQP